MPVISDRLSRASSSSSGPLARGSAGTPELFVYGTLGLDEVVQILLDRVPRGEETAAPGWRAAELPDLPYPGLVPDEHAAAPGRVYSDLSEREWIVLDAFEDPTYTVKPLSLSSGRTAVAYVWPAEALPTSWRLEAFDGDEMETYLKRCSAWRERWEARTNS